MRFSRQALAVVLFCLAGAAAQAGTIYVALTGNDDTGNGSPGSPYRTIGKGIAVAVAGDTVSVGPGTYNEAITLKDGVAVVSQQGAQATVIDGGGTAQTVYAEFCGASTILRGFTVTDAQRGICSVLGSIEVQRCILTGISGGIYGGAVCFLWDSGSLLEDSLVYGNSAVYSAGIRVDGSSATVKRCTVWGNTAANGDGGITFVNGGTGAVESCILWNVGQPVVGSVTSVTYSDVQGGFAGTGNIDADPLIFDAASGDCRLGYGSPCVNTGASGGDMGCFAAVTVASSGAEYATIQAACTAIPTLGGMGGGSVLVAPGTYLEHVVMQASTLIDGASPYSAIVDGGCTDRCFVMASHCALSRLTIQNGSNQYGSGAITSDSCTVSRCIFKNNQTAISNSQGGGLYLNAGAQMVRNCLFYGNKAQYGGAINAYQSSATVTNCTIVDNNVGAGWAYGGIYAFGTSPAPASVTVTNCILWGDGNEMWGAAFGTVTSSYTDTEDGNSGTGNIITDPLFLGRSDHNYRIARTSPCLDAGTNTSAPACDLDGNPRPLDGNHDGTATTDMGAYETTSLLYNSSFSTGDLYNWNIAALAPNGTATVVDYGGRTKALRSYRTASSGAATTLEQVLAIPCTQSGSLSFSINIHTQAFTGNLDTYHEFPVKVFLYYQDATGTEYEDHRYFYIGGSSSDPKAELVTADTWFVRAIDFSGLTPAPAFLTRVVLQSQGWAWEAYFDDLDLVTDAPPPDLAAPAPGSFQINGGAAYASSANVSLSVRPGADAALTFATTGDYSLGGFAALAERFVTTSGAITGAGVRIWLAQSPQTYVVSLRAALNGADITSFTKTVTGPTYPPQPFEGSFPFPVNVPPGTTLYLVIRSTDGILNMLANQTDPYPNGDLWRLFSGTWTEMSGHDVPAWIVQTTQRVQISNDGFATSSFVNYGTSVPWTLSGGEGPKTVWMRYVDFAGNHSALYNTQGIMLDGTPPQSALSSPSSGLNDYLSCHDPLVIEGTASDASTLVTGVDVSYDNGVTWHTATNTGTNFSSWSYTLAPPPPGTFVIRSRATDQASNVETPAPGNTITLNLVSQVAWTQTSKADFESGLLTNIDTTTSPGSCLLKTATTTYNSLFQFSSTQGQNQWYYRDSSDASLAWNGNWWGSSTTPQIKSDRQMGYGSLNSSREWVAPSDGFVRINVSFQDAESGPSGDYSWVWLYHNGTQLYQRMIVDGDFTIYGTTVDRVVAAGDRIRIQTYDQLGPQWIFAMAAIEFRPAGTVLSRVLDGSSTVPWNNVTWEPATQPAGCTLGVWVRASDSLFAPGATLPAWTQVTRGQQDGLPAGRYTQYKAVLNAADFTSVPQLDQFAILGDDSGRPYAISDLKAQKSGTSVVLAWAPINWSPTVDHVFVYRATQKDLSDKVLVGDVAASAGTYTDTPPAGALYFYSLITYDVACRTGT